MADLYAQTGYEGELGNIIGKNHYEVLIRDKVFENIIPLVFSAADNKALAMFYTGNEQKGFDKVGREFKFNVEVGMSGSFGAFSEGGAFPGAGEAEFVQSVVPRKRLGSRINLTQELDMISSDPVQAIKAAAKHEALSVTNYFKHNLHRMLHGNGKGLLGKIAAGGVAGAGPFTLTLDATNTDGTPNDARWFVRGAMVAWGSTVELTPGADDNAAAVGTTGGYGKVLTNGYNAGATGVTVVVAKLGGADPAAADYLTTGGVRPNGTYWSSYNQEFQGFGNILDNTLADFQGIVKADYPDWIAGAYDFSNGGANVNLNEERLLYAVQLYKLQNGQANPNKLWLSPTMLLEYFKATSPDRRFVAQDLKGGQNNSTLTFNAGDGNIDFVTDPFMDAESVYLLDTNAFRYMWWMKPGFANLNGKMWEDSSDYDKKTAIFKCYGNFGTINRPKVFKAYGFNSNALWTV